MNRNPQRPQAATAAATLAAIGLLALMMLVSGCGVTTRQGIGGGPQATTTGTQGARTTPTATPARTAATTPVPGGIGCATAHPGASIPPAAVMLPARQGTGTIAVKVGQTVGVDLPAHFRWIFHRDDPARALTPLDAQGVLDTANNTCDWRFRAVNPGRVTLTFTGVFQCPPHTMCPALAIAYTYTLDVRA